MMFNGSSNYDQIYQTNYYWLDKFQQEKMLSKSPYEKQFSEAILQACPKSKDLGMSPETILFLDNMWYLVHSIHAGNDDTLDVTKKIFADGYLKSGIRDEQYPGVYTYLANSNTQLHDEYIYFIFPLYLLKSPGWFANIIESYGIIA